jgi:hypothetical protein
MKKATKALACLFLAAAALAAQATGGSGAASAKKSKKVAAPAKTATTPQPLTIPKDAVANANGTFTWTDKQGKKWNYVQTPFGVMRSEISASPASDASPLAGVKAFDEGDKVRFERPSTFGPIKWEKNKTELTDDERNLLNSQSASQNAKQD